MREIKIIKKGKDSKKRREYFVSSLVIALFISLLIFGIIIYKSYS